MRRRSPDAVDPLVEHLLGGTSADWLASTLREHGIPIGATTIKTYRARVRDHQTRSV